VDGGAILKGILLSGAFSAIYAFLATPALIRFLTKRGFGQFIREDGRINVKLVKEKGGGQVIEKLVSKLLEQYGL
jgi:UDP-N-acetylmuramyl pentapeptide phosphotransferase/UDP-N-acetylglucosamine-1-phosphate transferase